LKRVGRRGQSNGQGADGTRLGAANYDACNFAEGVEREVGGFAKADDQQACRFQSGGTVQESDLAQRSLELAGAEQMLSGRDERR